jgi:uncharacterized membrane protein
MYCDCKLFLNLSDIKKALEIMSLKVIDTEKIAVWTNVLFFFIFFMVMFFFLNPFRHVLHSCLPNFLKRC